jgi:hypothetical protein
VTDINLDGNGLPKNSKLLHASRRRHSYSQSRADRLDDPASRFATFFVGANDRGEPVLYTDNASTESSGPSKHGWIKVDALERYVRRMRNPKFNGYILTQSVLVGRETTQAPSRWQLVGYSPKRILLALEVRLDHRSPHPRASQLDRHNQLPTPSLLPP